MKNYKKLLLGLGIFAILIGGIYILSPYLKDVSETKLASATTLQPFQGGTGIATSTAGKDGNCLTQASSSPFLTYTIAPCLASSSVSGSGTTNQLPLWVSASTLGNSIVSQSGNTINFSGPTTSTITSDGTNSNIAQLNNTFYLPSSTAIAAGGCPLFPADTTLDTCINDIYNSVSSTASSTHFVVPPGTYSWSDPTGIVFGNNGETALLECAPGRGTRFNVSATTGTVMTVNFGTGTNAGMGIKNCSTIGTVTNQASSSASGLVGLMLGGTNGAPNITIDGLFLSTFSTGIEIGANTYNITVSNSTSQNAGYSLFVNPGNNSGENLRFFGDFLVNSANASATKNVYFAPSSVSSADFFGGSIDAAQLYIESGNLSVNLYGVHHEDTLSATLGPYSPVTVATDTQTTFNEFGGTYVHDAGTASTSAQFINCGANCNIYGTAVDRNGSVGTSTSFIANTISPSNAKIHVSNIVAQNSPFINTINSAGGVLGNGDFYSIGNSRIAGFGVTNPALQIWWGDAPYLNTVTPSGGSGANVFTYIGTNKTPSSTLDTNTFGCSAGATSVSTTLAVIGGNCNTVFTGSVASVATLPIANLTQNRLQYFTNRGTANIVVTATSTDLINIGNTTTTSYTLTRGGSIALQNDGASRWVVVSRTPQRYISPSISGNITGVGCDSATTTVDTWLSTSTADSAVFSTTETTRTAGLYWNTYLTSSGIATTFACSDVTLTVSASTATFTVN